MEGSFLVEEVRKVIICMRKDKSPRPDGFFMLFYQECWDIIQEDIMKVFEEFFETMIKCKSLNATFFVLLPKKKDAKEMSDFHPISLVSSLYKIIAKVLSIRLKE